MKVLTAEQMREVDRRTIAEGIPGLILMENAALRVVEVLQTEYAPLHGQRIVILCGKGNNGGDGFAVARQLFTRGLCRTLHVVLAAEEHELQGDAADNLRMWRACGGTVATALTTGMRAATLVIDALLGTGLRGPARGRTAELIAECNSGFANAKIVSIDIPSGMASDGEASEGPVVQAERTITFTAPKRSHALPPLCHQMGRISVHPIGTAEALLDDADFFLSETEPHGMATLFTPRHPESNKGSFGHVLVIGGSHGKTGAPSMTGVAALRAGAGLVTVASTESAINTIAAHAAELMTVALPENEGHLSYKALSEGALTEAIERKDVIAIGPGLGTQPDTRRIVRELFQHCPAPMVVDADALNALATGGLPRAAGMRILTPHPGEMARLCNSTVKDVQAERVVVAREFAQEHGIHLVLKGQRTLLAQPDGRVTINPTGSPALATGGTGDILTGLVAGLLAQFPEQREQAATAAVWLHGRAGELAAEEWGDKSVLATDLLRYLPRAMRELASA